MKNLKLSLILSGLIILSSNNTLANGEILTGDPRLACEAILCLSSGKRPDECTPSIRRYFSITDKKLHRLIRKRLNFLNLCPKDNKGIDKDVLARIGLDQEKQKEGWIV
ncbi:TrbM/KikA/MpfK family conjugal transfer protein [Phocoenobacter uteri]|uniref:TrbM/KikA/MpfK family conjugal transfer protein n=1 Tax=Phocoenobacter uteri TaxID=146806 RepID=UPI0024424FCB|nr:TrbM/KikA/MpfK family conjugal transfer protein [Phocoenobacter uteri]